MFKVNECRKFIKNLFTAPEYTKLKMSQLAYIKAMCYSNLAGDYEITGFEQRTSYGEVVTQNIYVRKITQ